MKHNYLKGVADHLNNKFGDDFTMAEPWPDWMRQEDEPMTSTCIPCDAGDDLLMQATSDENDDEKNHVGRLRIEVVCDNEEERNIVKFYYEKV